MKEIVKKKRSNNITIRIKKWMVYMCVFIQLKKRNHLEPQNINKRLGLDLKKALSLKLSNLKC